MRTMFMGCWRSLLSLSLNARYCSTSHRNAGRRRASWDSDRHYPRADVTTTVRAPRHHGL